MPKAIALTTAREMPDRRTPRVLADAAKVVPSVKVNSTSQRFDRLWERADIDQHRRPMAR
jgi:hypothetical protein